MLKGPPARVDDVFPLDDPVLRERGDALLRGRGRGNREELSAQGGEQEEPFERRR